MTDREKVILALKCFASGFAGRNESCHGAKCAYYIGRKCSDVMDDAIELLREQEHRNTSAQPEIIRCKDCRWGREVCGNIECFVDSNIPPEYHGYEWFCPNGERRTDEQTD